MLHRKACAVATFVSLMACIVNANATSVLSQTFDDPTVSTNRDQFGHSVAISGNTVLIAAPFDNTNGTDVGQVHLFDATTGALLHTFDDPTPTTDDSFGFSVAVSGNDVLIGAPFDSTNGNDVGQAHLFDATTGALLHTFDDPTVTSGDNFGHSVAISGNTVLIGAPQDDTNGNDVGRAHLFDATTGALLQTFNDPTVTFGDRFGQSVAISGNTVLIGAPRDNTNGNQVGQAHSFDATTGTLLQTFDDPTVTSSDNFGISVAISGNTVLIGAPQDDTNGNAVGQAHLFDATTGALLQTFDDPTVTSQDRFGTSVAIEGNNVLIGAYLDDTNGNDVGQAHMFDVNTGILLETLDDPTVTFRDGFGTSVAIEGNAVLIGAYHDNTNGFNVGQAHLFFTTFGGATGGHFTTFAGCFNITLGEFRSAGLIPGETFWDCEVDGLTVNPGDTVATISIGIAKPGITPVSGVMSGVETSFAKCINETQVQQVTFPVPAGENGWDCEAAGLSVNTGDSVRIIGLGNVQ